MTVVRSLAAAFCIGLHCVAGSVLVAAQEGETRQPRDPASLVVVHSWTGRTAAAGREIAAMVGAEMLLARDPISGAAPAPGMDELARSLSEGKVRRLYLGFPIWNEAPSAPAERFVETAPIAGVTVIPFYTYLHYVEPAALARLADTVRARGGTPVEPLALRVPLFFTDSQIACLARRTLLEQTAAWPWAKETSPAARCAPSPPGQSQDVSASIQLCRVPAGSVWLGDTSPDCVGPAPRATRVDAFDVDRAEVTLGQYRRCVEAGKCAPPQASSGVSKELIASGDPALPVPGISHAAARAYCGWRSMRLPTEAEWMRAGRGDGIASYPWGNDLDATALRGNFGDPPGAGLPHYSLAGPDWPSDAVAGLARGCRFPAGSSPFGVCDLAGNLAEWVADADDPGGKRPVQILKGGSWLDAEPTAFRLSARAPMPVELGGFYLSGFRCARSETRD